MDFFERQASAQRRTGWLLLYFALALLGIMAALQGVFSLLLSRSYFDVEVLGPVAGGVAVVVGLGSLIKIAELSQGGRAVAAMLGGEPVTPNTLDPDERRLLNVVEEMSIASGVPVPEIFVLPDRSINAFAAGHGPGDTAIGVTRGCIQQLTRDELQGVIAHEFSHILHGDMKLNLRLMGLLGGILCLAVIGGIIMRSSAWVGGGDSDRRREGGGGVAFIVVAGVALYAIGWIGVFFANLIKAAVSREREFLADASAVQYTRNPSGIAGALWKIGKLSSRLSSPRAQEASHMYFGNGMGDPFSRMFATHPPLEERIEAIAPGFEPGELTPIEEPPAETPSERRRILQPQSLPTAVALLAGLPEFAGHAVRDLQGACAFVYALLLDEREDWRTRQLAGLSVEPALLAETTELFARRASIERGQWLPLVDLVVPTLRHLSPDQYGTFRANVKHLIEVDGEIHLFEFALQKTLIRHLDLSFSRPAPTSIKFRSVVQILADVGVLLSSLAWVGQSEPADRDAAFAAAVRELLINASTHPITREDGCDLARVNEALDRLAEASPQVKRTVLAAAREAVMHNGIVETGEYELLRAISDSVDCPLPPMPPPLPGA